MRAANKLANEVQPRRVGARVEALDLAENRLKRQGKLLARGPHSREGFFRAEKIDQKHGAQSGTARFERRRDPGVIGRRGQKQHPRWRGNGAEHFSQLRHVHGGVEGEELVHRGNVAENLVPRQGLDEVRGVEGAEVRVQESVDHAAVGADRGGKVSGGQGKEIAKAEIVLRDELDALDHFLTNFQQLRRVSDRVRQRILHGLIFKDPFEDLKNFGNYGVVVQIDGTVRGVGGVGAACVVERANVTLRQNKKMDKKI